MWLQGWIAVAGAVYWFLPPSLPHQGEVVALSLVWSAISLGAILLPSLDGLSHRASAFAGFLFFTLEGLLWSLGVVDRPLLGLMAGLHGSAFLLAVVGKYRSGARRSPRLRAEQVVKEVLDAHQESLPSGCVRTDDRTLH